MEEKPRGIRKAPPRKFLPSTSQSIAQACGIWLRRIESNPADPDVGDSPDVDQYDHQCAGGPACCCMSVGSGIWLRRMERKPADSDVDQKRRRGKHRIPPGSKGKSVMLSSMISNVPPSQQHYWTRQKMVREAIREITHMNWGVVGLVKMVEALEVIHSMLLSWQTRRLMLLCFHETRVEWHRRKVCGPKLG